MPVKKDKNSIFRVEALQHKREGWLGPSRLHIPSSLTVCLFTGLIAFALLVLLIVFGSYSQRVNVTGTVVFDPPAVLITAQSDGVITYSSALEAKNVKRSELIFSVSGDIQTKLGATNVEMAGLLKKQRNALAKKINILTRESETKRIYLARKIKNKEQEIESLQNLIKKSEEQSAWFEKKSNQYASLRGKGIALDSDLIERTKDYYLATESLSSAKVKLITLLGELLDLKKRSSSIDGELDERRQSFIIDVANIEQKILDAEKNKQYLIVAPFDGMITSVTAHVGERVTAGQQIAVVIPHGAAVRVELLSQSDSLGEIANGQRVKMRVAAYPYQWYGKIAGIIETLSAAPINMASPAQAKGNDSGKGLFRIVVRPELTEQHMHISLLPGMEVETEIYVKTRKVYQWLFMPVQRAYERATDSME
ncbi:HlyD family secretion protein [Erwinia amylovora]|uniref:HlyD family secretion protein n=1 Tax=Erwinia amylovora TaxID=552 RepID=UPI0014438E06|nr:HlyD family efflux transporter periplasmic adaptor subunit [Erwinia amylovora]